MGTMAKPRQRRLREDAIRNRADILSAVGQLLREDPGTATMPAVAERAGLSLATAYRYFPTLDELHRQFMLSVIEKLHEATKALSSDGRQLFEDTMAQWLKVVAEYGPAMVLIRSREGFLGRLAMGDEHTIALQRVWGIPIRRMLAEANISELQFPFALAIHNALFNSRELMDLRAVTDFSDDQIVARCTRIYWNAIQGLREPES